MDPVITSALISGGSSLLGGLFGRKDKPKNDWDFPNREKLETERYKWLVKGAQKAGFNPLTVLGVAGQTAGMGQPTSTTNPLSFGSVVGKAIASAGQTFANNYDPVSAEGQRLDNELRKRQIVAFDNERNQQGATPQDKGLEAKIDQRFDNLDPAVQSGLGTVDLGSLDANDMRIDAGPLKNQYVVRNPMSPTETYVLPKTFTPQEGIEGIAGDVGGEAYSFLQAINAGKETMLKLGIKPVSVHPRTGVVTPLSPQGLYQDEKPTLTAQPQPKTDKPWIDLGDFFKIGKNIHYPKEGNRK